MNEQLNMFGKRSNKLLIIKFFTTDLEASCRLNCHPSHFQRHKLRHTLKSVGRKMQMDVFIISIFAENELNVTPAARNIKDHCDGWFINYTSCVFVCGLQKVDVSKKIRMDLCKYIYRKGPCKSLNGLIIILLFLSAGCAFCAEILLSFLRVANCKMITFK